jgi:hypothetical protein
LTSPPAIGASDGSLGFIHLQVQSEVELPQALQHSFARSLTAHIHIAVVGVAHEPVAASLQFPIHFVQQHVGQQRRERPALRRSFVALHDHAVVHDASVEVSPNQPQYGLVVYPLGQPIHEHVVIDPVEELLQIDIHHHPPAFLHMALCLQHGIVCASARPEAVARFGERRINQRLQDLQQGLLNQSIGHGRYSQFPHATPGLGDLHPAYRLWPVTTRLQIFPDPGPFGLEILGRGFDRQSIHPSTAAIGLDAFPRPDQIRSRERLREQTLSPQAFGFLSRRSCFIAFDTRHGFTSPSLGSPRLPGLLMRCTSKRHGLRLSFSFGPSLLVGSYYGLG